MSETREWLAGLKPGDRVFHLGMQGNDSALKVKRLTKTQIICWFGFGEIKFRLSDGFNVGADAWSLHRIVPMNDDRIRELWIKTLSRKAIAVRGKVMIPKTEDELISFIADLEKWVPIDIVKA